MFNLPFLAPSRISKIFNRVFFYLFSLSQPTKQLRHPPFLTLLHLIASRLPRSSDFHSLPMICQILDGSVKMTRQRRWLNKIGSNQTVYTTASVKTYLCGRGPCQPPLTSYYAHDSQFSIEKIYPNEAILGHLHTFEYRESMTENASEF